MKRVTIFSLAMGLLAVLGTNALAHEAGKGPHGGQVREFGSKYHMEGVAKGGEVHFYLLDADAKAGETAQVDGGSITVLPKGGSPVSSKIEKGSFSEGSASGAGSGSLSATIILKMGGKSQTAKFTFRK